MFSFRHSFIVFALILILATVGCASSSSGTVGQVPTLVAATTSVPVFTQVVPTPTTIPLVQYNGNVFFDLDGNGLHNDGVSQPLVKVVCPAKFNVEAALAKQNTDGVDLFQALHTYLPGVCDNEYDQIVEVAEPFLIGYTVVLKTPKGIELDRTVTDQNGYFSLSVPANANPRLFVEDPNASNSFMSMGYINIWKNTTTIPSTTIDDIVVPELTLDVANVTKINDTQGVAVTNTSTNIGLMQGQYTAPICKPVTSYYDHTRFDDGVLSFAGSTKLITDLRGGNGTLPNHKGTDWTGKMGDFLYAMNDGTANGVSETPVSGFGSAKELQVYHRAGGANSRYTIMGYGHLLEAVVTNGEVYRGQIVALVGNSGTNKDQPHLHLNEKIIAAPADPFSADASQSSIWILSNVIVCPSVKFK